MSDAIMDELLGEMDAEAARRRAEALAAWRVLVRGLVAGAKPTREAVEAAMAAAAKSADQLRDDVAAERERVAAIAAVGRYRQLAAGQPKIEAAVRKANAALSAAQEHHREAVAPLAARLAEIHAAQVLANTAEGVLVRTPVDPAVQAERDAVYAAHAAAFHRIRELREIAHRGEAGQRSIDQADAEQRRVTGGGERTLLAEMGDPRYAKGGAWVAAAARAEAELPAAEQDAERLWAELAAAERRLADHRLLV